jgi:hypothetical protein
VMSLPDPNARQAYSEGRLREDGAVINDELGVMSQ